MKKIFCPNCNNDVTELPNFYRLGKKNYCCTNCNINITKLKLEQIVEIIKKEFTDGMKQPICPLMIYWEGDEDKCDVTKCDFNVHGRGCTHICKRQ